MASELTRETRKARENAFRRIRNMQEGIKKNKYQGDFKRKVQQDIKDLRRLIQQTRMRDRTGRVIKSHNEATVREALESLRAANKNASYALKTRGVNRNQLNMLKQQLNLASGKAALENSMEKINGEFSYLEKSIFFKATQRLWENADIDKRLEAIADVMKQYGVRDLYDFAEKIINKNSALIDRFTKGNMTPEEQSELERSLRDADDSGNKKYEKYPTTNAIRLVESMSPSDLALLYQE